MFVIDTEIFIILFNLFLFILKNACSPARVTWYLQRNLCLVKIGLFKNMYIID